MTKDLKKILLYTTATGIILTFVQLFLNLYIWKQGKNLVDLAYFNTGTFASWIFSYSIGSYLFQKTNMKVVFRISAIASILLFAMLLFPFIENRTLWIIFSGCINGIMRGINSSGSTLAISIIGKGEEFTSFFQLGTLYEKTVNIVIPMIFAVILSAIDYRGTFLIMLLFSCLMFLYTYRLPDIRVSRETKQKKLWNGFSINNVFKEKNHRYLPLSYLSGGIFSEFQSIFLMFFTFTITDDYIWFALLNIFYTLLTLLSIHLYKKIKIKDETWLFIGIATAFIGFGLSIILHGTWMIIPNILLVFGNFYYRSIYFSQQYQAIGEVDEIKKMQITTWREILLCVSRLTILSIIILFYHLSKNSIYWLFGITLLITLCVPFIHRSFKIKNG